MEVHAQGAVAGAADSLIVAIPDEVIAHYEDER